MKMKSISMFGIVAVVLMAGAALGAWLIYNQQAYTATVSSSDNSPVVFSTTWSDISLDTLNGTDSETQSSVIHNADSNIKVKVNLTETVNDTIDDCTYADDCTFEYSYQPENENVVVLNNGDEFNLTAGDTVFSSTINCQKLSCPSQIGIEMVLQATE